MIKKRLPKETDQEEIEKAFNILKACMNNHPEIESTLWSGAVWSILADGYYQSGIPYKVFCKELDEVKNHYKSWFEK